MDLTDDDARLVYADELQRVGDPRGELIVIQHRLQQDPNDAAAKRREAELFAKYEHELFVGDASLELVWHLGFIRRATVFRCSRQRYEFTTAEWDPMLRRLLAHESSSQLEILELGSYVVGDEARLEARLEVMLAAGDRPTLHTLRIGDHAYPNNMNGQDLCILWPLYPHLRRLELVGRFRNIGPILFDELHTFRCSGALERKDREALRKAHWPRLQTLGLQGTTVDVNDIVAIVKAAPALRHLELGSIHVVDELCAHDVFGKLESLALANSLSDSGAAQLARKGLQLRLDVRGNDLATRTIDMLKAAFPSVQADDPRYYEEIDE